MKIKDIIKISDKIVSIASDTTVEVAAIELYTIAIDLKDLAIKELTRSNFNDEEEVKLDG